LRETGDVFAQLLEKLRRHEDLSSDDAAWAMGTIMDGQAQPAHIAGLLMGLALKGERPAEMVGFARAMRQRAVPLPSPVGTVFDTCGTGGDAAHTFNVSTAAAIVVAGSGVRVAKHGNRAVSSRCGSADVFEALGVELDATPDQVVRSLEQAGLAFFFAPQWHPSMRHAGPTRRELGVRTAFNLLGPLTNPASARRQLIGVSRPEQTELVARTLGELGAERAWVVHGAGGLDELSTLGHTKVSELRAGAVNTFWVHPADVGVPVAALDALAGGTAADNAAMIERLLDGETGPRRDIVLFNAGAALLIAGAVSTMREGLDRAAETIATGRARTVLARMREVCGA
jgi:anthranilate phosphoribosyltransferase